VPDDAASLEPWLAEAVAAIQGRGSLPDDGLTLAALLARWERTYPAGETLVGVLAEGGVIGLLRARVTEPSRLIIDALTVRADRRNLGYGQDMVFALEESRGRAGGVVLAGVPPRNGLAIYFWLRTGYRPLYPRPRFWFPELDPALFWMERSTARLPDSP
jgi:GNAT superfamily N-acetyltransferase